MNLGEIWTWEKKKLPCRIRQESGNPAVDDLRERVAELAGINLSDFLEEGKGARARGQTPEGRGRGKVGSIKPPSNLEGASSGVKHFSRSRDVSAKATTRDLGGNDGDVSPRPKFSKEVLRTLNSAKGILTSIDSLATSPNRNIHKKYLTAPKFLPSKVVRDVQKECWQLIMDSGNGNGPPKEEKEDDTDQGEDRADEFVNKAGKLGWENRKIWKKGGKAMQRNIGRALTAENAKKAETHLTRAGGGTGARRRPKTSSGFITRAATASTKTRDEEVSLVKVDTTRMAERQRVSTAPEDSSDIFKTSYKEGLFGTGDNCMAGMVYMSRMPTGGKDGQSRHGERSGHRLKQSAGIDGSDDQFQCLDNTGPIDHGAGTPKDSVLKGEEDTQRTRDQTPRQRSIEAKIQCAATLLAWARHSDNAQRLAQEGAVEAILKLCKTDNLLVRGYCSAAVKRFTVTPVLRAKLVAHGGVPIIVDMASKSREELIQANCMVALANLTCINGQEAMVVEDGLVLAMVMIMNEQENFGRLCAMGLFNLTCVSEPYSHIERVLRALVGISSSSSLEVKQTCASAFCNLADLPTLHSRMIEEGVISTIGGISRGASTKTRRICAIAFNSLAASKQERTNLVLKGSVPILYTLSNDEDAMTLRYVACTLVRLSVEEQCHGRMIREGAISALCNIIASSAGVLDTSLWCAFALNTLSKHAEYQVAIADEGGIPAIVALLSSSKDVPTQYYALMTLCNLATMEENHAAILQEGALTTVFTRTGHTCQILRESCTLVLFKLSCGSVVQERIVQAGSVPAIIALSSGDEVDMASQRRCAAALCNLACAPANITRMVEEGVIPSIIHLLKTGDTQCVKEECREHLCKCGALPALIQLASMDDEATKLRCTVAFANLSGGHSIRGKMVEAGVVRVLSELSTSYKEKNQLYCARVLCNLAYHRGSEMAFIEGGGVAVLMMIALVRSVSPETKQICATALLNLVTEDTLPTLIDEGIVATVTNLSKLDDEDSMRTCALVFALLSANARGRAQFVERKPALVSLFELLRSKDQGTQIICAKAICNLACCRDSRLAAAEAGVAPCLRQLAKLGVPEVEAAVAMAFLLMVDNSKKCRLDVTSIALPTVVYLSRSPNAEARNTCARTLGALAWHEDSRAALYCLSVARALVDIIQDTADAPEVGEGAKDQLEMCTRTLYFLATDETSAGYLVEAGIMGAFSRVMDFGAAESVLSVIAGALRFLTQVTQVAVPSREEEGLKETSCLTESKLTRREEFTRMTELVVAQGAGTLVSRIIEATASTGDDIGLHSATLYDCAVVVFNLASAALACVALQGDLVGEGGEGGVLLVLATVAKVSSTLDLVVATLVLLSNDPDICEEIVMRGARTDADVVIHCVRQLETKLSGAELVITLAGGPDGWTGQSEEVVTNALCALFLMSRVPPSSRERLKDGGRVIQFVANLSKRGSDAQKKMASDALGNLTRDVAKGIGEGTVAALISRLLDDPGDMDDAAHVIRKTFVAPRVTPPRIEQHTLRDWASAEGISYNVQTVDFVKKTSGEGGDLPPPPEPPAIERQGLSVPAPPHGIKSGIEEEDNGGDRKAMQFVKMDVPEEFMALNDEELVVKMEPCKSGGRKPNEDYEIYKGATPEDACDTARGEGVVKGIQGISSRFQGDESSKLGQKPRVNRTTTEKSKETSLLSRGNHRNRQVQRQQENQLGPTAAGLGSAGDRCSSIQGERGQSRFRSRLGSASHRARSLPLRAHASR